MELTAVRYEPRRRIVWIGLNIKATAVASWLTSIAATRVITTFIAIAHT